MRELFDELRIKDWIGIMIILLVLMLLINSVNIFSTISSSIAAKNSESYSLPVKARVVSKNIKEMKTESQSGSKLKKLGYEVSLSYSLDSLNYESKILVLYANYKGRATIIDSVFKNMMNDSIWIMLKPESKNEAILKLN